jgi:hypothetical protein
MRIFHRIEQSITKRHKYPSKRGEDKNDWRRKSKTFVIRAAVAAGMGLMAPHFAAAQNRCQQQGVIAKVHLENYPALKGFINGYLLCYNTPGRWCISNGTAIVKDPPAAPIDASASGPPDNRQIRIQFYWKGYRVPLAIVDRVQHVNIEANLPQLDRNALNYCAPAWPGYSPKP